MKYFISLVVSVCVLYASLSAVEYGSLVAQNEGRFQIVSEKIILNDGDIFEICNIIRGHSDPTFFRLLLKDTRLPEYDYAETLTEETIRSLEISDNSESIIGPAEIFIYQFGSGGVHNGRLLRVSYKITRAAESEYKNVNIISLPTSAVGQGTHEIVVEASDDLQSWTPVHSSSIGGNKTFFRTRVTEIGN